MTEDIETFLGTVSEATAKTIAAGIGLPPGRREGDQQDVRGRQGRTREARAAAANTCIGSLAAPPGTASRCGAAAGRRSVARRGNCQPAAVGVAADTPARHRGTARRGRTPHRRARRRAAEGGRRANAATLEARIDELTLGPVGAGAPLFVTVGRNCKPQRHESLERPSAAAARRAQRKSEVLVLEPVGRIVRGTEWMPDNYRTTP